MTNLNQDGLEFWWQHKTAYLEMDDLEKFGPDTTMTILPDGSLEINVNMRPHQVSLLELEPLPLNTGAYGKTISDVTGPVHIFPNPSGGRKVDEIRISDLSGRIVKLINITDIDSDQPSTITWYGETNTGQPAASGNYIVLFVSSGGTVARKLILLR